MRQRRRTALRSQGFTVRVCRNRVDLAGKIDWIWVDCFTRFALSGADASRLQAAGFRLCLVSPELQGRDAALEIPRLVELLAERMIRPDAVCTKRPDLWEHATWP